MSAADGAGAAARFNFSGNLYSTGGSGIRKLGLATNVLKTTLSGTSGQARGLAWDGANGL